MSNVSNVQHRLDRIEKQKIYFSFLFVCFLYFGAGPYEKITMTERPSVMTEGVAQSVICSVLYKCRKDTPTIVWSYSDMQSSMSNKKLPNNTFVAQSNLTFIGSLEDNGKSLTCTAQFIAGKTSDSTIIQVKSEYRFYALGTREDTVFLRWGGGKGCLI